MPKRSNEFQQLIYSIQQCLAVGAIVTESKFLIDRQTGDKVEVDIVIESIVNGFPITISIEVRDRGRPATIEWIRESIGKHLTLPTNKLVLVSKAGFTKSALIKATENEIETLSLEQAGNYPWSDSTKQLAKDGITLAVFSLSWQTYSVDYTTIIRNGQKLTIDQNSLNDCIFTGSSDGSTKKLVEIPDLMLADGNVAKPIMQKWIKDEKADFEVTWRVPKGSYLTDKSGNIFALDQIKVVGKSSVKKEVMKFEFNKLQGMAIAHATVNDIVSKIPSGGQLTLTIIDKGHEESLASITLPKEDELGRRMLAIQLASDTNKSC
ncbi:MAG: hypothetical protein E6Q61_09625 [Nitrosomonas sp.]|nr:MAG: hypothetical protein E6Q61_09625 [Nitrosomonas sp.]